MRLDMYISQKLWVSRNRAQFFVQEQKIKVNQKVITKVAYSVNENDRVEMDIDWVNYVSRSALKLKWFLENEKIDISDKTALDIGSSTGGFTQILLEKWIQKVYSLDVGTSQLHPTLLNHPKIVSIENTDIRKFEKKTIKEPLDVIVCDVSFISLSVVIDAIIELMEEHTKSILLFKPQFEVGKENLTKLGVPKNEKIIEEKMSNFCLILQKKWVKIPLIKNSVLTWENGNKEIFILIEK